jgi:uncharacterized protein YdaU (DUF1376 family)
VKRIKPTYIPLFPDSYYRDTRHLSTEEHGAYLLLMMAAWAEDDCSLSFDEKKLAAIVGMPAAKWRKIASTVLAFWTIEDGKIYQRRLRKEWDYVQGKREQARHAVATREQRRMNERSSSDASSDVAPDVSPIGGGGGGGPFPYQEDTLLGGGSTREGFRVYDGGAR